MLAIPLVKCDQSNLSTNSLKTFLNSHNSNKTNPNNDLSIDDSIALLCTIRADAISIPNESVIDSTFEQQKIIRYSYILKSLCARLNDYESELGLTFGWKDAFNANKKAISNSLYLEFACCLWNLGSIESLKGAKVDRSSEDGIRTANKHFQLAAGYFEYIKDIVLPNLKSTSLLPCLSIDCLNMTRSVMLAQAQLCFYEKAVKDKKAGNMKAAIIAKIAMQTSKFYSLACQFCGSGNCASLLDVSWHAIADFQSKCFHGAAEYWQSVAAKETALQAGTGYGEEIARLNRAELFVKQSLDLSRKFTLAPTLPAGAEGLLSKITSDRKSAVNDLNTIYMESVPQDSSLTEISAVAMVKPSVVLDTVSGERVLFAQVLPKAVYEGMRKFDEVRKDLLASTNNSAVNATNYARSSLSSVGLPGSLEAIKSESPLPDSLWAKVQRIQTMGGFARLESTGEELQDTSRRALMSMGNIEDSLNREERKDNTFRSIYPHYPGVSSSELTSDVRLNNQRMRDAYNNAKLSDEIILKEIKAEEPIDSSSDLITIKRLSTCTKEELCKLFPTKQLDLLDMGDHSHDQSTVQLEDLLNDLAELIENREKSIISLKTLSDKDYSEEVMSILSNSSKPQEEIDLFLQNNLTNYTIIKSEVEASITKQTDLLNNIMKENEIFTRSRETDPLTTERNKIIQKIEQSIAKYSQLQSQLSAGITFYSNLQMKLTTLLQSSDDLAYTQQWQRQEFEAQRESESIRSSQEALDREIAMKLANEMNLDPSPPTSAPLPPPLPSLQMQQQYPGMVYGTPVAGPPPNLSPIINNNNNNNNNPNVPQQQYQTYPGIPNSTPTPSYNNNYQTYQPQHPQQNIYQQQSQPQPIQQNAYQPPPAYQQHYALPPPPPTAAAASYQYNNNSYSVNPPPVANNNNNNINSQSYQPPAAQAQYYNNNVPPTQPVVGQPLVPPQQQPDFEYKVSRLCEMGFPRDQVYALLVANNGDQDATLNSLLSASSVSSSYDNTNNVAAAVPPPVPPKPQKSSWGWGKK